MSLVPGTKCDLCGVVAETYGLGRLWHEFTWKRYNDPFQIEEKHACDNCWYVLYRGFKCSLDVIRSPMRLIDHLQEENEGLRKLCDRLNAEIKAAKR